MTTRERIEELAQAFSRTTPVGERLGWWGATIDHRENCRQQARVALGALGQIPSSTPVVSSYEMPPGIVAIGVDERAAVRAAWMVKLSQLLRQRIATRPTYALFKAVA